MVTLEKYADAAKLYFKHNKSLLNSIPKAYNALLYFLLPKSTHTYNQPISAQIEPTIKCNLDCIFCVRKEFPIGDMSLEDFKLILSKLNKLVKIHLQGLGEPFLHKDIFKMIAYARSKGILVYLNSNATLINKNMARKICNSGLNEIAISIDSLNKKKFESIRRGAKFEKVVENITQLTNIQKQEKSNLIISLAVTVMEKNIQELEEFIKFAVERDIHKIIVQTLQSKESFKKRYSKQFQKQLLINEKQIEKEMAEIVRKGKNAGIEILFDEKIKRCVWPWRNIYITWNGYVTPCCKIVDYKKPVFGNLLKQNLKEVWNGPQYKTFRKLMLKQKVPPPCKGCNILKNV